VFLTIHELRMKRLCCLLILLVTTLLFQNERAESQCWRLKWKVSFYPHIGDCGYDASNYKLYRSDIEWDFNYDDLKECKERAARAANEADDSECGRTVVSILTGCEPCERAKSSATNAPATSSNNSKSKVLPKDKITLPPKPPEPTDAQKLGQTVAKAAPGILRAIEEYNSKKEPENRNDGQLGRPEGFYESDPNEDEWTSSGGGSKDKVDGMQTEQSQKGMSEKERLDNIRKYNESLNPNDNGFVIRVKPSNNEDNNETGRTIIMVKGVFNENITGVEDARSVANILGVPVTVVSNKTEGLVSDAGETYDYRHGMQDIATYNLERSMEDELRAGNKVRAFVHSEGGALAESAVNGLKEHLIEIGQEQLLNNLEVITLGGANHPAAKWPDDIKVLDVANPNDIIPFKFGHGAPVTDHLGLETHYFNTYVPWIEYFGTGDIDRRYFQERKTLYVIPYDK
jgi:hypothetical protein